MADIVARSWMRCRSEFLTCRCETIPGKPIIAGKTKDPSDENSVNGGNVDLRGPAAGPIGSVPKAAALGLLAIGCLGYPFGVGRNRRPSKGTDVLSRSWTDLGARARPFAMRLSCRASAAASIFGVVDFELLD
jgi:hypothetical protein